MKKIVKGNDFTLRIPVSRMVNGEAVPFPLPGCTDIVVNVVSSYRRISLPFSIDVSDDHIINARVEGDAIPRGIYALEVKGKFLGNDWRSNEYEQFSIVDNNASGDTAFTPQEGEDSVLMNTALIILAPDVALGGLIKDAESAIAKVDEKLADVDSTVGEVLRKADAATEQATTAATNANTQADRAKAVAEEGMRLNQSVQTAENMRIQAEKDRGLAEEGRSTAESKRQVAESGRNDAEVSRVSAENMRKTDEATRIRQEAERKTSEEERIANETARVRAEEKRAASEQQRVLDEQARNDAEAERVKAAKENKAATDQAVKDCQQAVADAKVSIRFDHASKSLIIRTGKE
jgi:hypothetical protein